MKVLDAASVLHFQKDQNISIWKEAGISPKLHAHQTAL